MTGHYVMLTKPDCKWCDAAKVLIEAKDEGVELMTFEVKKGDPLRDFMLALNLDTVPQIWWVEKEYGAAYIGGYNELVTLYETEATLDDQASD